MFKDFFILLIRIVYIKALNEAILDLFYSFEGKTDFSMPVVYVNQYRGIFQIGVKNYNEVHSWFKCSLFLTDNFFINPSEITISYEQEYEYFSIAAKGLTISGFYYLNFKKSTLDEKIIAPSKIHLEVMDEICELNTELNQYDIPFSGFSFPIIIDFSYCRPVYSLELIGKISSNAQDIIFFDNESSIKKILINENKNLKNIFILKNSLTSNNTKHFNFSTDTFIEWELKESTTKQYFNISNKTSLNIFSIPIINKELIETKPYINFFSNNIVEIVFIFEQEIIYYYMIYLSHGHQFFTPNFEDYHSLYENIVTNPQKEIKPIDFFTVKYGLAYNFTKKSRFQMKIDTFRPNSNYTIIYYICDHFKKSEKKVLSFITPDNLSRFLKITFTLLLEMSISLKKSMACLFALHYHLKMKKVWTDDATFCDDQHIINDFYNDRRLLQIKELNTNTVSSFILFFDINYNLPFSYNFIDRMTKDFLIFENCKDNFLQITHKFSNYSYDLIDCSFIIKNKEEIIQPILPKLDIEHIQITDINNNLKIKIRLKLLDSDGFLFLVLCQNNLTVADYQSIRNETLFKKEFRNQKMYLLKDVSNFLEFNDLIRNHHYSLFYYTGGDYPPSLNNPIYSDIQNVTIFTFSDDYEIYVFIILSNFGFGIPLLIILICGIYGHYLLNPNKYSFDLSNLDLQPNNHEFDCFEKINEINEKLDLLILDSKIPVYPKISIYQILYQSVFYNIASCHIEENNYLLRVYTNSSYSQKYENLINDFNQIKEIKHTNILNFHGIYIDKTTHDIGILFEKLPKTLKDLNDSEGELSIEEKFDISIKIIEAIIFFHEKKISFCNLNSDLIFLDESLEIVKIIPPDFNLHSNKNGILFVDFSNFLKNIQEKYCAPELTINELDFFNQKIYNDIWALGIILFEVFSNNGNDLRLNLGWLGPETNFFKKRNKILSEEKDELFSSKSQFLLNIAVNNKVFDIINECLQINYKKRPTSEQILQRFKSI